MEMESLSMSSMSAGTGTTVSVIFGDLFDTPGQKVISTNDTFDTSRELISDKSLQGFFAEKYFPGDALCDLDSEIELALRDIMFDPAEHPHLGGKSRKYPMGAIAKIHPPSSTEAFFMVAMATLDEKGTARSGDIDRINFILNRVWSYFAYHKLFSPIVVPLIGTGRGRLDPPVSHMEMIKNIALSFERYSKQVIFAPELKIVVHAAEALAYGLSKEAIFEWLFENFGKKETDRDVSDPVPFRDVSACRKN